MNLTRRLMTAIALFTITLVVGTVGYELLTHASFVDALYMTVITLSTVGYGEVVPGLETNPVGRVFTMFLILIGMGILLYVLSTSTAFLVEGELSNILRRRRMEKRIKALRDHIIVCGAGTTGVHVIHELQATGQPYVVIDESLENLEHILEKFDYLFLHGDATAEEILIKANVETARGVISVLASDKDNLFVSFTTRQLNPRARIVARGTREGIQQRLLRAGADAVVFPNRIGGLRMASEMLRPHVVGFLDRMLRAGRENWRFEEICIPSGTKAVGQTLGSLRIEERAGLPVLALSEQEGNKITYYPSPDTVLDETMKLVFLVERTQIPKLNEIISRV